MMSYVLLVSHHLSIYSHYKVLGELVVLLLVFTLQTHQMLVITSFSIQKQKYVFVKVVLMLQRSLLFEIHFQILKLSLYIGLKKVFLLVRMMVLLRLLLLLILLNQELLFILKKYENEVNK